MSYRKTYWLICLAALFFAANVNAQDTYTVGSDLFMKVEGTSTMKDWSMKADNAGGKAVIKVNDGKVEQISSLTFNLKANTLKSNSDGLNEKAHESLKAEDHPEIKFKLKEVLEIDKGSKNSVKATGDLTIGGVTKKITMTVKSYTEGNKVIFEGSAPLKMTDFDIDPPSFMWGAVSAGDKVKVNFKVNYIK